MSKSEVLEHLGTPRTIEQIPTGKIWSYSQEGGASGEAKVIERLGSPRTIAQIPSGEVWSYSQQGGASGEANYFVRKVVFGSDGNVADKIWYLYLD